MEKTNLGTSIGLLGAILCFSAYFGGYEPAILIGGYILIKENNSWLRTLAVRVLALTIAFSVATCVVNLIPDIIGWISSFVAIFNEDGFSYQAISRIIGFVTSALGIIKTIAFLALGFKALKGSTVKLPVVDAKVSEHL